MARLLPTTPQRTYLYRLFDAEGALLYIGITCNLPSRFGYHRSHTGVGSPWFGDVARSRIQQYATRAQAELAEAIAIRQERPRHNKRLGRLPKLIDAVARS